MFKFKELSFKQNLICQIFGHKNIHFKTMDTPSKMLRFCKRCGDGRELKSMNEFDRRRKDYMWMRLVTYTKFGAKEVLKNKDIVE